MRPYPLAEDGCRSIHSLLLEGNDRVLVGPGSGRLVIATTARALTWQWRLGCGRRQCFLTRMN